MTPEWMEQAACRGRTDEMFPASDSWRLNHGNHPGLAICRRCPVIQQCRDHALGNVEMFGTWGGLTENARRRVMSGMLVQVQCPQCRTWFARPMTGRALYCGPGCARDANRARQREARRRADERRRLWGEP